MPGRTRCLTRVNATRVRYWCSRIVYPVCCDGYVGVSLLYSLSGECREEDVHGSVYLCERGDSVAAAHWPSCYDVNVDTKDVLNDEVYLYVFLASMFSQPTLAAQVPLRSLFPLLLLSLLPAHGDPIDHRRCQSLRHPRPEP